MGKMHKNNCDAGDIFRFIHWYLMQKLPFDNFVRDEKDEE